MFEDQMTNVARKRRQDLAMQDLLTKSKKIMSNAYNWDKLPQLDLEAFGQFYGTKVGKGGDLSLILPDLPANPGQNNSFGFKLLYNANRQSCKDCNTKSIKLRTATHYRVEPY